jgi:hypothetical protein
MGRLDLALFNYPNVQQESRIHLTISISKTTSGSSLSRPFKSYYCSSIAENFVRLESAVGLDASNIPDESIRKLPRHQHSMPTHWKLQCS